MRDDPTAVPEITLVTENGPAPTSEVADQRWRATVARWFASRPARWLGGALVVALVGVAALVSRDAPQPGPASWPVAAGPCGVSAPVPILDPAPLASAGLATGAELLVGPLRRVAVDSGVIDGGLEVDGLVIQVVVQRDETYLLVRRCPYDAEAFLVAMGAAGQMRMVDTGPIVALLPDADTVWALHRLPDADHHLWLYHADTRRLVQLPRGFDAVAVHGDVVVGRQAETEGANPDAPAELSLVSMATGAQIRSLGPVAGLTVDRGVVFWSAGPCTAPAPCSLRRYDLTTGHESTSGYYMPKGGGFGDGVVSHDGRQLAFALPRAQPDARYRLPEDRRPADLAVLDLKTGDLRIVGGIELPGGEPTATLAFSADNQWLFIAVVEGNRTRLLAWQPGLPRALESPAIILGPTPIPPSMLLAASLPAT